MIIARALKSDEIPVVKWPSCFRILRNVIPPEQLDGLRVACEILVDRQRHKWRRERKPDEPEEGEWVASEQPLLHMMMIMCNPVRDRGPAFWRRDIHPIDTAPLQGHVDDIIENGPRYVQCNTPLYDGDVLWGKPGTHLRLNTDEEDAYFRESQFRPLPGNGRGATSHST